MVTVGLARGWHHGVDSKPVSSPQRRVREEAGKKALPWAEVGTKVRGGRDGCGHGSPRRARQGNAPSEHAGFRGAGVCHSE